MWLNWKNSPAGVVENPVQNDFYIAVGFLINRSKAFLSAQQGVNQVVVMGVVAVIGGGLNIGVKYSAVTPRSPWR